MAKDIQFILGSVLVVTLLASLSKAQGVQRTFVSGLGSDGNPCSRTAPCRTFTQAISQTNAGGEVYVLDSAGYGPFTISQAVSIVAPAGVTAGISVFSGTGVTINANSGDTVILRGLTINNQGSTGDGISFANQGTLHVENCVVNGFNSGGLGGEGLIFSPAGSAILFVKDTIFRGNLTSIDIVSGSALIDRVTLEGRDVFGSQGLIVKGGAQCAIRDSVVANFQNGLSALSSNSSNADLEIDNCSAFINTNAVTSNATSTGTATVRISNSTITQNSNVGLFNGSGSSFILSRGNNTVEGNAINTSGTIGSYSPK